jgi:hypothetical protein
MAYADKARKRASKRAWNLRNRERRAAYAGAWYLRNHEQCKARIRIHTAKTRARIMEIKRKGFCVDCGYNAHPAALDFDHIGDDKKFTVAKAGTYSWERVEAEIKKCVLRCANCHRLRHAGVMAVDW